MNHWNDKESNLIGIFAVILTFILLAVAFVCSCRIFGWMATVGMWIASSLVTMWWTLRAVDKEDM